MTQLLDTHAFVWLAQGDSRLSRAAREHISRAGNRSLISAASLWETAIKISIGKLTLHADFDALVHRIEDEGIELVPIEPLALSLSIKLPFHHRDPFDRLLVATAIAGGHVIISADEVFDAYGVKRIW